jgi:hypothetical protein
MPDNKKQVNDVKVVEAVDNATGEQVQVPVEVPENAPTVDQTGAASSSKPAAEAPAKQYKPPITGATEPMQAALASLFTPPPVAPASNLPAIEPEPHEAEHWAEGKLPKEWEKLRDEAQQVAREAANAAYARGVSEQDAITEGVIQAQNWAKAHSVNVRK